MVREWGPGPWVLLAGGTLGEVFAVPEDESGGDLE